MDDHTARRRDELLDAVAWLRASILEDGQALLSILEHANLAELVDDVTLICLNLLSEYRDRDSLLQLLDNMQQRTEELAAGDPPGPQPDDDDPIGWGEGGPRDRGPLATPPVRRVSPRERDVP